MKAMRGRIALQKHFVRNHTLRLLCFAQSFGSARASSRRFWILQTDRAQIPFGGSRNGCFCICEDIRLPPAAINLLE